MSQHASPGRGGLPLPDYDHLPATAVGQRIRSLTSGQLRQLLDYEREHANRPAITQVMRTRLAELDGGAVPSGGEQQAGPARPEPSAAQPAASPETARLPTSAPPHGNPAQPARPKGNRQG